MREFRTFPAHFMLTSVVSGAPIILPTMSESGLDSTVASRFSHLRAWSLDEVC